MRFVIIVLSTYCNGRTLIKNEINIEEEIQILRVFEQFPIVILKNSTFSFLNNVCKFFRKCLWLFEWFKLQIRWLSLKKYCRNISTILEPTFKPSSHLNYDPTRTWNTYNTSNWHHTLGLGLEICDWHWHG